MNDIEISEKDVHAMAIQLQDPDSSDYQDLRLVYDMALRDLEEYRDLHKKSEANLNRALMQIKEMRQESSDRINRLSDALAASIELIKQSSFGRD